ncbi:hypothetical protein HanRHA438_Chr15g0710141 [Helianthus annuus]|nr:hypothetical protein HanRHA438_Chr15g0710141 [Helianthus annuus]
MMQEAYLHLRYKLMAWLKNPLPRTPLKSATIGIKDIEMTFGACETVESQLLWL